MGGPGPGSVTWKYFGDWRGLLQGLWAGSMQNMHPKLGAAVEQHSEFFSERWARLFRSLYPIGGVVFDGDRAEETGREVRDYHRDIKGVDSRGRRYHALDPDVFYWAHATFFYGTLLTAKHFCGGISDAEVRALFDEHKQWYARYGVSTRHVPDTWEDFQVYWDTTCRTVLEDNRATREVLDLTTLDAPPGLPAPLWRLVRPAIAKGFVWLTVGMYDQPVRDLLGYRWTPRDERLHRALGTAIHWAFALVPERARKHPRARDGLDRASGRLPADTPLIHTPTRHLPRDHTDPRHYCPVHAERRG
ncbi:oxygenase MpaB family protein [Actinokineospora bangkokensis]|uniref:oxygenase MpaB family protein n=1 Tax=Actinokineospora bangkokensis TaxID=1193682 RepID=UPI000ACCEBBF|nr:oxygenase MpaB family protein [Actinokineospora bangkokensis]